MMESDCSFSSWEKHNNNEDDNYVNVNNNMKNNGSHYNLGL